MKKAIIITLSLICNLCFGQINIDKLNIDFKINQKPIIIYFYTDWCAYCKIQEKEIEKIKAFQETVYFIKLNAESDQKIHFLGIDFNPNKSENNIKTHEFVKEFIQSKEQESYPFLVILDKNLEVLERYNGLLTTEKLTVIINALKKGTF